MLLSKSPIVTALGERKCWSPGQLEYDENGKKAVIPYKNGGLTDAQTALRAIKNASHFELLLHIQAGGIVIDLDHCRDSQTAALDAWAQKMIDAFPTYW